MFKIFTGFKLVLNLFYNSFKRYLKVRNSNAARAIIKMLFMKDLGNRETWGLIGGHWPPASACSTTVVDRVNL